MAFDNFYSQLLDAAINSAVNFTVPCPIVGIFFQLSGLRVKDPGIYLIKTSNI